MELNIIWNPIEFFNFRVYFEPFTCEEYICIVESVIWKLCKFNFDFIVYSPPLCLVFTQHKLGSSYSTYDLNLTRPWAFLSVSTFWIGFCQLNFYQNFSNFFGGESWHQLGYFDILLNLLSLTKVANRWR